MKKIILLAFLYSFFLIPHSTFAAEIPCKPLYGGGDDGCSLNQKKTQNFSITKEVMRPGKGGDFIKTLNTSDVKFAPEEQIIFRLTLKNNGSQTIPRVIVVDTLPSYLDLTTGQGAYDAGKRTLTFQVDVLEAGKPQVFYITTKAASQAVLPADKSVICVNNQIKATVNKGKTVQDNSQACIQKPGNSISIVTRPSSTPAPTKGGITPKPTTMIPSRLPTPMVYTKPGIKQTPPTGPEMLAIPFLAGTGAMGYFLRKKS